MNVNSQDILKRALAMLSSLEENVVKINGQPSESYVDTFHNELDSLEGIGIDVGQFRVPPSEVNT